MKRRGWQRMLVNGALALVLAFTLMPNLASAHPWSCSDDPNIGQWHWNRYGSSVTIYVYNFADYWNQADAARADWSQNTLLYLPSVNYHTDISLYDGNFGDTGWAGLASIESSSYPCHITHGHAKLNYYYSMSSLYKQGVFCQEVGHLFGLDHSDTGDCMGLGYYSSTTYYVGPHNVNDIYNLYRYSHH